jgi:hypothetical protein
VTRRNHLILGLALVALVAGCGGSAGAQPTATPRRAPTHTATSAVQTPTPTPSPQAATPTATATPHATQRPTATATPTAQIPTIVPVHHAPRVLSASLSPATVAPGGSLTVKVETSGTVSRVQLYIGSGAPSSGGPSSFDLSETSSGTWTGVATAPSSPGQYHYSVGVFSASGRREVADNDTWNITVSGGSGPQPLPDDLPLAPPFSYGSPVAATFTAEGRTINGSEVSSNARPDVPAGAVAQFYEVRFPRSGWTIDPSTIPGKGAVSFTMAATSGSRVAVVEFASGVVHIFYGPAT